MGDQFQFLQSYKQCFSLADMELLNIFSHDHHNNNLMGFSHDHNILAQPAILVQDHTADDDNNRNKKRKAMEEIVSTTPSSSAYSSPQVSQDNNNNGISKKTNRGKKAQAHENVGDVIHVRAKRGHATDSHSLAERVRRGKINERLRCLQDIVPGCYKTMGMAVMLDEIINYVQSLQNQVEFLSMKLTAATTFNDFNSDTDAILNAAMQRTKTFEAAAAMKIESNGVIGGNLQQFCPNFEHPSYLT